MNNNSQENYLSALFEIALTIGDNNDFESASIAPLKMLYEKLNLKYIGYWHQLKTNHYKSVYQLPTILEELKLSETLPEDPLTVLQEKTPLYENLNPIIHKITNSQLLIYKIANDDFILLQTTEILDAITLARLQAILAKYEKYNFTLMATNPVIKESSSINEQLKLVQNSYTVLYNNTIDGIFIYNYVEERVVDCNQSALNYFKCKNKSELIGRSRHTFIPQFSSYFPNIDLHKHTLNDGRKVNRGEVFRTPGIFLCNDGTHMLVDANVIPIIKKGGDTGFIVFRDVTNDILNKKALVARERQYRHLFNNAEESIIFIDIETRRPVDCNDKTLEIFGLPKKEILYDVSLDEFYATNHASGTTVGTYIQEQMKEAIEKGKSSFSIEITKPSNKKMQIEGSFVMDKSDKRQPKLIAYSRDITESHNAKKEQQRFIKELGEKKEELERYIEANMQLENFAHIASHDLKTPIRTIVSFTQLLRRSLKERIKQNEQEYMTFIIDASRNMENLINDLLLYSTVNTTEQKIEDIDLIKTIEQIVLEFSASIKDKNAIINFMELPPIIRADKTKLRQLIQNLIANALKFVKKETQPIINVEVESHENFWQFAISDNGIGINKAYQEKIFLLFRRLHTNRDYEGTGIGLAICKKIVEQHEGKIWLESKENKGTTFYFTISKNL